MKGPPLANGPNCCLYKDEIVFMGNPYYPYLVVQMEIYEDGLALLSSKSSSKIVFYKREHVWFH